jgi:CBS domain-containing protein
MERRISELLASKGKGLHALGPDDTVADAVHLMNRENIGAVMVFDPEERLMGLFTERDVLRRVIDGRLDYKTTRLEDVMTRRLATLKPSMIVEEALQLVNQVGCRHLPVLDGDRVLGMISIRDLTNTLVEARDAEISELTEYIAGSYGH